MERDSLRAAVPQSTIDSVAKARRRAGPLATRSLRAPIVPLSARVPRSGDASLAAPARLAVPSKRAAPSRLAVPAWIAALAWLATLAVVSPAGTAGAADATRPHPHQGLVPRYEGAPPRVVLGAGDEARLARGEAVRTRTEDAAGGRGIAVQDIRAGAAAIWDRIGAFRDYPRMVDHVVLCEPYLEDGSDVRVRFVLRVIGIEYEYFIHHDFRPDAGFVTWTLDYTRESDLDESVGYWAVTESPGRPGWSRLYYAIDMRTRAWMPGFLRSWIADRGLEDATGWVKREAEAVQARWDAAGGAAAAGAARTTNGDQRAGESTAGAGAPPDAK